MAIKQFVTPEYGSNTYLISDKSGLINWLIDAGNVIDAVNSMPDGAVIEGVFLTHPHVDHIIQVNELISRFPSCNIYTSSDGKSGLYSDKLNLSFYHDRPVILKRGQVVVIGNQDIIVLDDSISVKVYETKGHNPACLTFQIGSCLFTGDSFIPGIKVVTKLKGGNRLESIQSLRFIRSLITDSTVVCPGHGSMLPAGSHLSFPDLEEFDN